MEGDLGSHDAPGARLGRADTALVPDSPWPGAPGAPPAEPAGRSAARADVCRLLCCGGLAAVEQRNGITPVRQEIAELMVHSE